MVGTVTSKEKRERILKALSLWWELPHTGERERILKARSFSESGWWWELPHTRRNEKQKKSSCALFFRKWVVAGTAVHEERREREEDLMHFLFQRVGRGGNCHKNIKSVVFLEVSVMAGSASSFSRSCKRKTKKLAKRR